MWLSKVQHTCGPQAASGGMAGASDGVIRSTAASLALPPPAAEARGSAEPPRPAAALVLALARAHSRGCDPRPPKPPAANRARRARWRQRPATAPAGESADDAVSLRASPPSGSRTPGAASAPGALRGRACAQGARAAAAEGHGMAQLSLRARSLAPQPFSAARPPFRLPDERGPLLHCRGGGRASCIRVRGTAGCAAPPLGGNAV
jgi:hypothetical protein